MKRPSSCESFFASHDIRRPGRWELFKAWLFGKKHVSIDEHYRIEVKFYKDRTYVMKVDKI